MRRMLLLLVVVTAILLATTGVSNAGSLQFVTGDPNAAVFSEAADRADWTAENLNTLLITLGDDSSAGAKNAVVAAAEAGKAILAFGAEEDGLLSMIPGAGGNSRRLKASGEVPVAWYARHPEGFYSRGIVVLSEPLTADDIIKAARIVDETVKGDRESVAEVRAKRTAVPIYGMSEPLNQVTSQGHGDLVLVTVAHPPFYGDGWATAHPYGKVGRGLMVEMAWNDGNDNLDWWFLTPIDQVVPGIYDMGSDWRSDEYRAKWVPNYSYMDVLQAAPPSTEPFRNWSVTFGFPISVTLSGQLYEMRIYNLSQLYGTPNFAYERYDFTANNASISKLPYAFDFSWSQTHWQNLAFDATSYQTYDLATSQGATHTMRFQDWSLNVHKPGY